jgi:ATP adenylyltransferase
MAKPLWAPWRLEYIAQADELEGCVFCAEAAGEIGDDESLVVHRDELALALLNKFPYASGHLMVATRRHVARLEEVSDDEALALHRLTAEALAALAAVYRPDAYNVGWNLGDVAGGSLSGHLHEHVVPRWRGDTNFMPVLADVKVLPEHLLRTRDRLREAWAPGG